MLAHLEIELLFSLIEAHSLNILLLQVLSVRLLLEVLLKDF